MAERRMFRSTGFESGSIGHDSGTRDSPLCSSLAPLRSTRANVRSDIRDQGAVAMVVGDATFVSIELENDASACRCAPEFLRDVLRIWCLQGVSDAAELLTGELVANVVLHVGSPMELRASRRPASLRIEVDDPSTKAPVGRRPDPAEAHGRRI